MQKLLEKIDNLVTSIQSDTNRSELPELSIALVELAKMYWQAKQEYIRAKYKYDNEVLMETESFRWYFEKLYETEYQKELETNPKAKKNKTTNVECETQARLKHIWLKNVMEEHQITMVYLEPVLKQYQDLINSWKFIDRETVAVQKTYNDTKVYDDLPF